MLKKVLDHGYGLLTRAPKRSTLSMRAKRFTFADFVARKSTARRRDVVDWAVFARRGPSVSVRAALHETGGGQTLCLGAAIAALLCVLSAVWPAFGETLKALGQIAVLYFKTGMRG